MLPPVQSDVGTSEESSLLGTSEESSLLGTSEESSLPSAASSNRVFTNKSLNLAKIKCFGYVTKLFDPICPEIYVAT